MAKMKTVDISQVVKGKLSLLASDYIEPEEKPFDQVGFIMAYEGGELQGEEIVAGFQKMLDSGIIGHLQGHYQRTAQSLIESGAIGLNDGGDAA